MFLIFVCLFISLQCRCSQFIYKNKIKRKQALFAFCNLLVSCRLRLFLRSAGFNASTRFCHKFSKRPFIAAHFRFYFSYCGIFLSAHSVLPSVSRVQKHFVDIQKTPAYRRGVLSYRNRHDIPFHYQNEFSASVVFQAWFRTDKHKNYKHFQQRLPRLRLYDSCAYFDVVLYFVII